MYKRQLRALSPSKRAGPNQSRRNVENDENRLSLVEPGEKVTGVEEEKTEVKSVDEEEEEPPLSPIVGYDIDSDAGDNATTESSDTDPETERCLISLNSKLALDTSVDQNAVTPGSPRSARRQRLRKRRLKQLKEKADGDDESPKRQKLMDVQTAKMNDAQSDVPTPAEEPTFVQFAPVTPSNGKLDFKTASGKEVVVSEEALKMAHRSYAEVLETLDVNDMGLAIKSASATSSFSRPSTSSSSSISSATATFRIPSVPTANVPQKSTPASTLEKAATTERTEQPQESPQGGMTQDILECIEACLADDDEGGF